MTREELKAHCEKQIEMCEIRAIRMNEKPSGKVYEEHKLILELLEQESQVSFDVKSEAQDVSDTNVGNMMFEGLILEKQPNGRTYYSVEYKENGEEHIGYSSYDLQIVGDYIKEYFVDGQYARGYNDAKREIALSGEYERCYERGKADAQQKTGHWITQMIFQTKLYDEPLREYECSECGRRIRCTKSQLVNYSFCHCGAKMEVVK